jgi:hypothetical protein
MFEIQNIMDLARELDVDVLAKVIFSFTPDIIMSPLALPAELLHPWLDELIESTQGPMQELLKQLRTRPTFSEQWGSKQTQAGLIKGKQRILQLEHIRNDSYTMRQILSARPAVLEWYDAIA